MSQGDDFSAIANGAPRAEVELDFLLEERIPYQIQWYTYLPADYESDSQQAEIISQIHQSNWILGSPPFALLIDQSRYKVIVRGPDGKQSTQRSLSRIDADKGRWVHWSLKVELDSSGRNGVIELTKDGAPVLQASGVPNSYSDERQAYFKVGVYKWDWLKRPTDVRVREMMVGPICIQEGARRN